MTTPDRNASTHIAPGTKIVGQVTGEGRVVIDGAVEGKVDVTSDVTIGRDGQISGDVVAKNVKIGGKVRGNVRGHERVEIVASGRLEGDVVSPRMVLAEGAFFKGRVEMSGAKPNDQAKGVAR